MSITFVKRTRLPERYKEARNRTQEIVSALSGDRFLGLLPATNPLQWHLGVTTSFFEQQVLQPNLIPYEVYDASYPEVFHDIAGPGGTRVIRKGQAAQHRITGEDIAQYRWHVDKAMGTLLEKELPKDIEDTVMLGINYEEQHQELLYAEIKHMLGHHTHFPSFFDKVSKRRARVNEFMNEFVVIPEGIYSVGYAGSDFCFDNEHGRHKVYLHKFKIARQPVTNEEFMEFITDGGYGNQRYWHTDGIEWMRENGITAPLYWHDIAGEWHHYTLAGLRPLDAGDALCHVSYYEASAFAAWKGMRLPTEFEWEAAANDLDWGQRWEWTNSAYLPYPGFREGAQAHCHSGRRMVNQMVLRGASEMTPAGHSRVSYRNFTHPHQRRLFSGIRLAK